MRMAANTGAERVVSMGSRCPVLHVFGGYDEYHFVPILFECLQWHGTVAVSRIGDVRLAVIDSFQNDKV